MKEMGRDETVRCLNCKEEFIFFVIGHEIAQKGDPQAEPYNAECPFCHTNNKILIKPIDRDIWSYDPLEPEKEKIPLKPYDYEHKAIITVQITSALPFHKRVPFQPDPFPIPMRPLQVTRKLECEKTECGSIYALQNVKQRRPARAASCRVSEAQPREP
jgi:hypothetical protein